MKVTSKGQVTIPRHIRRYLDVLPHTDVDFVIRDGEVVLVKTARPAHEASRFAKLRGSKKDGPATDVWMRATRE